MLLSRVTSASIFCLKEAANPSEDRLPMQVCSPTRDRYTMRERSRQLPMQSGKPCSITLLHARLRFDCVRLRCDAARRGWRPAGGLPSASPLRRSASMRLITFAGARRRVHSACCAFAASGQAAGRAAEQRDELVPFHARHGCLPTPCGGSRAPQPSTHGPAGPLSEIRDLLANRLPRLSFVVRQRCE